MARIARLVRCRLVSPVGDYPCVVEDVGLGCVQLFDFFFLLFPSGKCLSATYLFSLDSIFVKFIGFVALFIHSQLGFSYISENSTNSSYSIFKHQKVEKKTWGGGENILITIFYVILLLAF